MRQPHVRGTTYRHYLPHSITSNSHQFLILSWRHLIYTYTRKKGQCLSYYSMYSSIIISRWTSICCTHFLLEEMPQWWNTYRNIYLFHFLSCKIGSLFTYVHRKIRMFPLAIFFCKFMPHAKLIAHTDIISHEVIAAIFLTIGFLLEHSLYNFKGKHSISWFYRYSYLANNSSSPNTHTHTHTFITLLQRE